MIKTLAVWSNDNVEPFKGCFLCTDWNVFHSQDIDIVTEAITDYIHFCTNNVVAKNEIIIYPNNKPYIKKQIKDCIYRKKIAKLKTV